jgi:ribosomal-protein-alanine N-acetyltransferase
MPILQTSRLALVPATAMYLRAELESHAALGKELNARIPTTWPPELYDRDAIRSAVSWVLDHPDQSSWGFHWVLRRQTSPDLPLLIGTGGFKGAPDRAGSIELGYGILPEHQRHGYATEAVRAWIEFAFASPQVQTVVGQTLPRLTASVRVLEKAGFRYVGVGNDPFAPAGERVVRYELRRNDFRRGVATALTP